MWNLFKHKKTIETVEDKPDVESLNQELYRCSSCHKTSDLNGYSPLSVGKCVHCEVPFFVPMMVHRYWLYKPLGGGGMGSVYKSVSYDDPDDEFAVKILPRERADDETLINALMSEAEIGHTFGEHPHLATITDFGECEGEYFSAMSYVPGQRLDELIEGPDAIDQKYVLLWALQILSAEQRMYDCGYLYRDLKPQNIIIDAKGNVHLIDYGLCVSAEDAAQGATSDDVQGSPLYMPPERIIGDPEGMSGEIYSLGMVMFHALTKKTYYSASGAYELAKKHVMSLRLAGVGTRMPSYVHPRIAEIIDVMIARLPEERYQNYRECGAEIKAVYASL